MLSTKDHRKTSVKVSWQNLCRISAHDVWIGCLGKICVQGSGEDQLFTTALFKICVEHPLQDHLEGKLSWSCERAVFEGPQRNISRGGFLQTAGARSLEGSRTACA